jgi:hypothetical protein
LGDGESADEEGEGMSESERKQLWYALHFLKPGSLVEQT